MLTFIFTYILVPKLLSTQHLPYWLIRRQGSAYSRPMPPCASYSLLKTLKHRGISPGSRPRKPTLRCHRRRKDRLFGQSVGLPRTTLLTSLASPSFASTASKSPPFTVLQVANPRLPSPRPHSPRPLSPQPPSSHRPSPSLKSPPPSHLRSLLLPATEALKRRNQGTVEVYG